MGLTRKQGLEAFLAGAQGTNPFVEGDEARKTTQVKGDQDRQTKTLEDYLAPITAGKKQDAVNRSNKTMLEDPSFQALVNDGGSVKVGDLSIGGDPYAHAARIAANQGPRQAAGFLKTAAGAYKPINEQLDAAQSTLDALNQGNATSDKIALINEARIAAGQGGSRAIAHIVDQLSGGQTSASNFQDKLNWLMNTPNIPTMQPAWRDAVRESVFNRIPQLKTQHGQIASQLAQQGPIVAPGVDVGTLIGSFTTPAKQKIDAIEKMQSEYSAARAKMGGGQISQSSIANDNPTVLDKLRGLFGGRSTPAAQPAAPQAAGGLPSADAIQAELKRRQQAQGN
jgi:hypothetical protein